MKWREKNQNAGHEVQSGFRCLWICVLRYKVNVFHTVSQGQEFENATLQLLAAPNTQQACNKLFVN